MSLYQELYGKRIDTIQGELSCRLWHVGSSIRLHLNNRYMPLELGDIQKLWDACQYGGMVGDLSVARGGNGVIIFSWYDERYENNRAFVIASVAAIENELIPILKEALSDERKDSTIESRKRDALWDKQRENELSKFDEIEKQRKANFSGLKSE